MKCPHCQTADLLMTNREGIEIDYCPQCRGVWLDRGELDKIIERATRFEQAGYARRDDDDDDDDDDRRRGQYPPPPVPNQQPGYGGYGQQPYPQQHHDPKYYKKKKSFWSELFD